MVEFQRELRDRYEREISEEVEIFFLLIRNKSLLPFLLIETFQSSIQIDLMSKQKSIRQEKGWLKTFKSSKKALMRFNQLYKTIFENQLKFLISYLTLILSIIDHIILANKSKENKQLLLIKYDKKIHFICAKTNSFYEEIISKYPNLAFMNFNTELPNERNLEIKKNRFIQKLEKLNEFDKVKNIIFRKLKSLYSKIKYGQIDIIPPEIIEVFKDISREYFGEILKYSRFFSYILNLSLVEKLNFLKNHNYDFRDWVNKDLRNKFVHDLDILYIKKENKLCGAKIISGRNRNSIISIEQFFESLCRLKALTNFLYNHIFGSKKARIKTPSISNYKLSNVNLMKTIVNNPTLFPK